MSKNIKIKRFYTFLTFLLFTLCTAQNAMALGQKAVKDARFYIQKKEVVKLKEIKKETPVDALLIKCSNGYSNVSGYVALKSGEIYVLDSEKSLEKLDILSNKLINQDKQTVAPLFETADKIHIDNLNYKSNVAELDLCVLESRFNGKTHFLRWIKEPTLRSFYNANPPQEALDLFNQIEKTASEITAKEK